MTDESIDLSHLSPDEYRKIIDVIKRDQDLKKQEEQRIFQLKAEIQRLRKRGIIKQGSVDPTRTCARCLTELGRIINRGAVCSICRKKVCKTCRHYNEDGQQWVCLVCHKQIQLKAITGEWMREYTRTASGRIKKGSSSSKSTTSDAISKSIKNTFRKSFLVQQQNSSSSSQSIEEDHEKAGNDESAAVPITSSSFSVVKTIAKGFIPSRLPSIDSLPPRSPPPKSPKSPKSPLSGSEHKSSTDIEDSPKLPPSPVLKVLQSAVDLVTISGNGQNSRSDSPQQVEKQTVFRKVSNRMLDSSSSEEEEEVVSDFGTKEELHKTNSSGSTPSPRTPNSCRILSSIAHNQATAFKFPPTSPINSRPSSYERQSERQSSDEFSTTMSSFRSRSTSSELCDENISDPRLTPQPLPRSRRVSPLRKQRAIAEEVQESQRSSLEAEYGSCPSSATTSAPDSGVADCNYASPPKNFFSSSSMRRSSSGHDDAFGTDPARELVSSLSEGEAVIEKSTGYVFRKVTVKKRYSNSQAMQQQFQNTVDTSTTCVNNTNASNHSHERPTGLPLASRGLEQPCGGTQSELLPTCITHISEPLKQEQIIANKYDFNSKYEYINNEVVTARHFNYETSLLGLGLRSRSYYYLYGSVNRCDGCDGCDKDMACERVNTLTSSPPTTNQNKETLLSTICFYCEKLVNQAFISANVEINRLRSMNVDYNDSVYYLMNIRQAIKSVHNKEFSQISDFKEEENFDFLSESEPDINLLNSCDNNPVEEIEEKSVSNLEKYYTCSLEEEITERRVIPPYTHFASMSPFSDNEDWVEDNNQLLETSVDINGCAEIDLELEAGNLSDVSTSSEEGLFTTPNTNYAPRPQPNIYGNPLAYSLHTIAEESCEESERESSRPSSPIGDAEINSTESDKCSNYAISHSNQYKRSSWCDSEAESIDTFSETSEPAMSADFNDNDIYLASSRLEKYFTSGLLGSGAFNYPDDVEFADESDCDSSKPSLEFLDTGENKVYETQSSFSDENFDTLKRNNNYKKIEQNKEIVANVDKQTIDININDEIRGSHKSKLNESTNFDSNQLQLNESQTEKMIEYNENEALNDENSSKCSNDAKNKVQVDEDVTIFMNKLLSRMSNFNRIVPNDAKDRGESVSNLSFRESPNENPLPSLKVLESQIARLMEAVSPANLSVSDNSSTYTSSSTIGSNNSDYGSDTLESDDEEGKENNSGLQRRDKMINRRESNRSLTNSGGSSDSTVSEETVYICKQLMTSLKKLTEIAFTDNAIKEKEIESATVSAPSDVAKARMYIRDQIVALMHTVKSSSRNTSPLRERKMTQTPFNHQTIDCDNLGGDSSDCGESSPKIGGIGKKKTPSESGSETTCSASVSIPSYDDSDHTPTESEISHEMEELFALIDSTNRDNYSGSLNESNIIGMTTRPSSDDDRASLKSWEARISLFAKVQAAEENSDNYTNKCESNEIESIDPSVTPNIKLQEITVNGKEIKHRTSNELNNNSNNSNLVFMPSGHKTVVKIDDINRTDSLSPIFDSLKDRSFSSDSVSSVQTVKARFSSIATASTSEISSDGTQSTSRLAIDEDDEAEVDTNLASNTLRKSFNAKEKASSEDNLLVANLMTAPTKAKANVTTKSAGNISELDASCNKSTFRDTGYYSFKSSEESIKSLDESVSGVVTINTSRASSASTLPHIRQPKSETIQEVDEESDLAKMPTKRLFTPSSHHSAKVHSFSSPNIPEDVFSGSRSSSLPLNARNKVISQPPSIPHRTRSSFFSTSGVLRKLTALRGDDNSFRASPRRLRDRNRNTSGNDGENTRAKHSGGGVPQISVSDYSESFSNRGSVASSTGESTERQDDDIEHVLAYHSRSQTSLSSFGARSESMSSVYSAAGGGRYGSVVVTGEILFCISYNYKAGAMEVYIRECRNLAPVDTKRNRSDPYVKVYLLPDRTKSGKRKTKVKKHTLNPVFEEVLKFYMTISEVETRTLWLSVWHSDIFGRNDFLGEVTLPLGHEVFETPGLKWYPLQERLEVSDNPFNYKGDIFLALKYMPPDITSRRSKKSGTSTKGELHVLIKEAHNLMATRSNGTSDPFCKSYLLPDKTKSGKQKTPVIKKTCNPKWNHTFVFDDMAINDLRDRCLELTIWDYDKITSNDFLGGVRLSLGTGKYEGRIVDWMDSSGDEIALWQQMLDRPNMWVYGELHLRSSMQTRRS